MKLHVFERQHKPGFRLNILDLAVIAIAAGLFLTLRPSERFGLIAPVPLHLAATFFLFCNVIRVRTRHEIAWSLTYVGSLGSAAWFDLPLWPTVLTTTTASFLAVVVHALMTGQHHGVFCRR